MPAIRTITDDLLINAIDRACQRVVLIAPGVSLPVAKAVACAWQRLGTDHVTAILDVDAEVCRFGYGSVEALEELQKAASAAGATLAAEPGVRICVVIADDETFVFSPTPRQLEAPPGEQALDGATKPKANGIVLTKPPASLETDLGKGPEGVSAQQLGLDALKADKLENVKKDLASNPVKPYDLTQAVTVYNAKIQFVELKVKGCRLSQHKAPLPKHLLKAVKRNKVLAEKIGNTIKLIDEKDELISDKTLSQDTVFKQRDEIDKEFLHAVIGVGSVIDRTKKAEFLKRVEILKKQVETFSGSVEGVLAERFNEMAKALAEEVLPDVIADLPPHWTKRLGAYPEPEQVRWRIVDDLMRAFGNPATKVGRMKVDVVFKDVTYDMLNDPKFRESLFEHFPDLPLMEEYKAAKQRSEQKQLSLLP